METHASSDADLRRALNAEFVEASKQTSPNRTINCRCLKFDDGEGTEQDFYNAVNHMVGDQHPDDEHLLQEISKSDLKLVNLFTLHTPVSAAAHQEAVVTRAVKLMRHTLGFAKQLLKSSRFFTNDGRVTSLISRLSFRVTLAIAITEEGSLHVASSVRDLLNLLSKVMDASDIQLDKTFDLFDGRYSYDLSDFIRVTWQQVFGLLLWYIFSHQVTNGYQHPWHQLLILEDKRINSVKGGLSSRSMNMIPRYMCHWAFKLLFNSRAAIGLSFTHFLQRFGELHEGKSARCMGNDPWNPCNGTHPFNCGRFTDIALVMPEQSVHADTCDRKCRRLVWDKDSYDSLTGCSRAVCVSQCTKRCIYTKASGCTMAISHVWSHGHGGRPGTGMNRCLHDRFSKLAASFGCDSYWIDTLCIPEDHTRRIEAIQHINETFANAKLVLVIDRDLMDLNISEPREENSHRPLTHYKFSTIPIELLESVLATFLVCDWNVRAWTMLEAMRGCRNLHFLCKYDQCLGLKECLSRMCTGGSIEIASMFLSSRHLLPVSKDAIEHSYSLESAGAILAYRHATRPGDDVAIWALMTGTKVRGDAADFWRSQVGKQVPTGFLKSSIERLKNVRGFSWAPETPYMRWETGWSHSRQSIMEWGRKHYPYDGLGSRMAEITNDGLKANWLFYSLGPEDWSGTYPRVGGGKNPAWVVATSLHTFVPHVALLDALSEKDDSCYEDVTVKLNDNAENSLVVIWSYNGLWWHWYGVYEWGPCRYGMPIMVPADLIIV